MLLGASMAENLGWELLWVGVVPVTAAAAAMLAARWLKLRPRAAWAASVGVGYVVGQVALASRGGLATALAALVGPREAGDWLPWAVALAAGTTIWIAHANDAWRWVGHGLAVVIVLAAPARLLGGSVYLVSRWSAGERIVCLAALAAALGGVWWLLEAAHDDDQPLVRSLLLIYTAVGTSVVLALSGSFAYGELCGVVAAALTGAVLAAALTPGPSDGLGGAAGAVTMSLGGLILLGYFYAELSAANAVLLVIALGIAGGRAPVFSASLGGWRGAARAALCIVAIVLAVAGAYAATSAHAAGPY
jgi:hypothetical protein